MANVQGKCCLLVKCQLQFTPCKHVTSKLSMHIFSVFCTVSRLECLFWNSDFSFPLSCLLLESGNYRSGLKPSQGVIRKAKTCRRVPIAHWHLGFPFSWGGFVDLPSSRWWAVGEQMGEPQAGGGWQSQGELWVLLHKCQCSLWWLEEVLLVTCGFGVIVWWGFYILISVLTITEQRVNQSLLPKI